MVIIRLDNQRLREKGKNEEKGTGIIRAIQRKRKERGRDGKGDRKELIECEGKVKKGLGRRIYQIEKRSAKDRKNDS